MDAAKIRLSAKEMQLVVNADWILTKNQVMEKAKNQLENIQLKMLDHTSQHAKTIHTYVDNVPPKISKGENYRGLPYLILDYPRIFEKENIFAIRTLFWWGNFFSITLHLSGSYKNNLIEKISAGYNLLKKNDFFYCSNENQWEHHFDNTNYTPLYDIDPKAWEENWLKKKSFVKIAKKLSLHEWNNAQVLLLNDFKLIVKIIT